MKINKLNPVLSFILLVCATTQLFAQGTAFTYQGQLISNGLPLNGHFDFQFSLYPNAAGTGTPLGTGTMSDPNIGVTNGLFITTLNFGPVFTGNATWLAISVRSNNVGSYSALTPLQELDPTPYAIFANTASNVSGPVSAAQLSGDVPSASLGGTYGSAVTLNNENDSFSGNGAGLTGVNAATVDGLSATSFWQLTGNSGTTPGVNFVGTSDNQPLEMHVNGQRALRLEVGGASSYVGNNTPTGAPNVIGGSQLNLVTAGVVGCVIAGGGSTNYGGGKYTNSIGLFSDFCVIGGGINNIIQTNCFVSVISGGQFNTIESSAANSFIGGGAYNSIQTNATVSVIGGGNANIIEADAGVSFIGGGVGNVIYSNSVGSIINGGYFNVIQTNSIISIIGGGESNYIGTNCDLATICGGFDNSIDDDSEYATISGGSSNYMFAYSSNSSIGGGYLNGTDNAYATVGGGYYNYAAGESATVGGGYDNEALGYYGTVSGGYGNLVWNSYATVPGGYENEANGLYSFAAGNQAQALNQGAFVWGDSQNAIFSSTANDQFLIRAQGGVGIGTNGPSAALHVSTGGNAGDPQLRVDQTTKGDYARLRMVNEGGSGAAWDVAVGGTPNTMNFFASPVAGGTGTNILVLQPNGNASLWGTLAQGSDRAHKDHIKAIDPQKVLAKVAGIPISEWNYTTEPGVPHLGPMAQDFYAAFNLGQDNKHITTIDEGGVALAAIQGLDQKLNEKDAEIKDLKTQNDSLAQRLNELESAVKELTEKK